MINAMRRILLSRVAKITRAAQHPITRVEETLFRRLISLVNQNNLSFSIIGNSFKILLHIINFVLFIQKIYLFNYRHRLLMTQIIKT